MASGIASSFRRPLDHPWVSLCLCFALWKVILFAIACLSPGPGYDTSTALLLERLSQDPSHAEEGHANVTLRNTFARLTAHVVSKLVRWDAIYFTQIAKHGYTFEQEWAFGWGFTRLISRLTQTLAGLRLIASPPSVSDEALVGIFLAHFSHLSSVIVLHQLVRLLLPRESHSSLAFVAAFLHIISPGGLFLSAPYTESLFSFCNFSGFYLYTLSHVCDLRASRGFRDFYSLLSGVFFGLATTIRSNGLLSGTIFLYDLVTLLLGVLESRTLSVAQIQRGLILGLSGLFIAAGTVYPQYLAFQSFCSPQESKVDIRPWCQERLPSIYAYAQSVYWDVGFLRYWTVSNLPLFLLAVPMLCILVLSATWALSQGRIEKHEPSKKSSREDSLVSSSAFGHCIRRLAIPQLLLAIAAFTNYHVQIISRISSGYVAWYLWVALKLSGELAATRVDKFIPAKRIVQWMVLYALIQGGLFATFLPPA